MDKEAGRFETWAARSRAVAMHTSNLFVRKGFRVEKEYDHEEGIVAMAVWDREGGHVRLTFADRGEFGWAWAFLCSRTGKEQICSYDFPKDDDPLTVTGQQLERCSKIAFSAAKEEMRFQREAPQDGI